MKDYLDVRDFHRKFGLPYDTGDLDLLKPEILEFRRDFMYEELLEFIAAFRNRDLVGAFDALIDLNYVIFGTALFMRPHPELLWRDLSDVKRGLAATGNSIRETDEQRRPGFVDSWLTRTFHYQVQSRIRSFCDLHHLATLDEVAVHVPIHELRDAAELVYRIAWWMGLPWDEGWAIVHEANMAKERAKPDGSNSKRGVGVDIVKPAGWISPEPQLRELIEDYSK